jgi:site-specific DNA-cytosine methylase
MIPVQVTFNDVNGTRKDRPSGGMYVREDVDRVPALSTGDSDVKVVGFPSRGINDKSECILPICRVENPPAVAAYSIAAGRGGEGDVAFTLRAGAEHSYQTIRDDLAVRRLTPRECERLQGWPDDWTRYGRREDGRLYEMADGPRYRMMGNGVTAPVSAWLARNLLEVSG